MKMVSKIVAVALLLMSTTVFAASLDGNYSYKSREKDGKPSEVGWTGTMKIEKNTIFRSVKSTDGKTEKFYEETMKNDGGDLYTLNMTKSYKPEYVGKSAQYKITTNGKDLTIQSLDGAFKEVWAKK